MQLRKGMKIRCTISDTKIPKAVVQEEGGMLYICQDYKGGVSCKDKMGFKYSWGTSKGDDFGLATNNVTDVKPLTPDIENVMVGDIITNGSHVRKVLGNAGEAWFISTVSDYKAYGAGYAMDELKQYGYKIVMPPEPDTITVTVEGKIKTISRISAKELGLVD